MYSIHPNIGPPPPVSSFQDISLWNVFNCVHDYKMSQIFQMLKLGKIIVLYLGIYSNVNSIQFISQPYIH